MTTNANSTNGTTAPTGAAAPSFGEAPASGTVDAISPSGRRWLLTTRANTVGELMQRVEYLDKWLSDHAWSTGKPVAPSTTDADAPICPYHNKPMTRRSRDGRSWWSCSEKLSNGEWCQYRPKDRP